MQPQNVYVCTVPSPCPRRSHPVSCANTSGKQSSPWAKSGMRARDLPRSRGRCCSRCPCCCFHHTRRRAPAGCSTVVPLVSSGRETRPRLKKIPCARSLARARVAPCLRVRERLGPPDTPVPIPRVRDDGSIEKERRRYSGFGMDGHWKGPVVATLSVGACR